MLNHQISIYKQSFDDVREKIITEDDINYLPELFQKYFKYCNLIGTSYVYNFRLSFTGKFRLDQTKPWLRIKAIQFNNLPNPTRLFCMKAYMFGIITMVGEHVHHQGKGRFKGKMIKLINLFDESGKAIDEGDLTTFLNDLILLAPQGILVLKDKLSWKEVNESTVEVSLAYGTNIVKAQLIFENTGKLINFISSDRYIEEENDQGVKQYNKREWMTPIKEYSNFNSLNMPSRAVAN